MTNPPPLPDLFRPVLKTRVDFPSGHGYSAHILTRWRCSSAVEQGNHNPLVGGSNPSTATISLGLIFLTFSRFCASLLPGDMGDCQSCPSPAVLHQGYAARSAIAFPAGRIWPLTDAAAVWPIIGMISPCTHLPSWRVVHIPRTGSVDCYTYSGLKGSEFPLPSTVVKMVRAMRKIISL